MKTKNRKSKSSPKVKLPAGKVILLASVITAVCIFMFFVFILLLPSRQSVRQDKPSGPSQSGRAGTDGNTTAGSGSGSLLSEGSIIGGAAPSESKTDSADIYSAVPPARNGAAVCIVFDDGGNSTAQIEPFLELPFPATVAVLPRLAHSAEVARMVRESGKELLLHQPMQAVNLSVNPGEGAVLPDMEPDAVRETVRRNLDEIGPVKGMNNHEGSLITGSQELLGAVLDVCLERDIFFLDSRTTASSRVPQAAQERGVAVLERNIFLDNTQAEQDILDELYKGLDRANRTGYSVMIGHVWSPGLPRILLEQYPLLTEAGYRFVTPSQLLQSADAAAF